jgi:hypothetical protein
MSARAFDTTWIAPGQPLSADKLKADLDDVQSQLMALQAKATPVMTAWAAYTPTVTEGGTDAGSSATTRAYWRRVGDTLEITLDTTFSSCAHSGQLAWTMPNGDQSDDTKEGPLLGSMLVFNTTVKTGAVTSQGSNKVAVDLPGDPGGGTPCSEIGAGGEVRLSFSTVVKGWTLTGP